MGAVSTRKRSLGNKILNKVFNRIGSLHGSIYIVNPDLIISDPEFQEENKFKSLKISFSKLKIIKDVLDDYPVRARKAIIVGPEYQSWVRSWE